MNFKKENRSYPRAKSKIEIMYFADKSLDKKYGFTKDFSATGVSFPVDGDYQTGDMIYLELSLPDLGKTIKTRATVIRSWMEDNMNYISVQFFDINYHDFIVLLDYSLAYHIEL